MQCHCNILIQVVIVSIPALKMPQPLFKGVTALIQVSRVHMSNKMIYIIETFVCPG